MTTQAVTAQQGAIEVFSPLDGSRLGAARITTREEALQALSSARLAQRRWAAATFAERRRTLLAFAEQLSMRADELAKLLSRETGKTLFESYLFEILSLANLTRYFAVNARRILRPRRIRMSLARHRSSYVHYKPRGVVLVISPWNFPMSIPFGEAVIALAAGNAVLLKPASLTPLIALRLRELFDAAGLDPDLLRVLPGPGRLATELIEAGVNYVNFTGSTAVGRQVAALCGSMLIPFSMELGGKDPALVLEDADLDHAARSVVWGAFANSGQICASIERVYVVAAVYQQFVERALAATVKLRQGDPLADESVDVGAMTDRTQIEIVEAQVREALAAGARALTGGRRAAAGPNYFEPTLLVDATDAMSVVRDETFGPLLPIVKVRDADEAVARANNSPYGLSAYVYSEDRERARLIAERLEAGTVVINDTLITHGFPETPWGGVKQSGIGRVHSDDGLRALCESYHVNQELVRVGQPFGYPYTPGKLRMLRRAARLLGRALALERALSSVKGSLCESRKRLSAAVEGENR